jgi:hypothetical protein
LPRVGSLDLDRVGVQFREGLTQANPGLQAAQSLRNPNLIVIESMIDQRFIPNLLVHEGSHVYDFQVTYQSNVVRYASFIDYQVKMQIPYEQRTYELQARSAQRWYLGCVRDGGCRIEGH